MSGEEKKAMKIVIGVMGPGETASPDDTGLAYDLGRRIGEEGWVLLSGGMAVGVMDAVNRGAREAGGLTLGILPGTDGENASPYLDISIKTGMGSGRNNLNVLSSDLVIIVGMSAGTASEASLAIKNGKPVVFLSPDEETKVFFEKLDPERVHVSPTPAETVALARKILQ